MSVFGIALARGIGKARTRRRGMKSTRPVILSLWFGACLHSRAQMAAPPETTNRVPQIVAALPGDGRPSPVEASTALNKPLPAKMDDVYHLDTALGYRRPLNGDIDWLTQATLSFGKMLDEHNSLDAVFGGGVMHLKPGSAADAQAHEPFFLELGVAWQYYPAAPDASWKPYVTAGASLLWMSWEYRSPVDSKNYGYITRDYLEGADGYAGVGLSARLRKNLDFFGEIDAGGVGFLSTTYSGEHNNLFANFGYVGFRGGFSLKF